MPRHDRRPRFLIAAMALCTALALGACTSDDEFVVSDSTTDGSTTTTDEHGADRPEESTTPADATVIELDSELTSQDSTLYKVGPDEQVVYGWNKLVGTSELDGAPVDIEMLGNVNYLDGSGEFFGFVTFTFDDGSVLSTRMTGEAAAATDTSNAAFESTLEVIGGTGKWLQAGGIGSFDGVRLERVGGAVEARFRVELTQG